MTKAPEYMRMYHYRKRFEDLRPGNVVKFSFGKKRTRVISFIVISASNNKLCLERDSNA